MRKVPVLFFILIVSILAISYRSNISEGTKVKENSISISYQELDKLPERYTPELAMGNLIYRN